MQGIIERKILLVDDDEATRILISEILEGANVTIIECACSSEAVLQFKNHYNDINLVLLDMKLPGSNGLELLKELRIIKPKVPAVAISALTPSEIAAQTKAAGFNAYVSKPIEVDGFLELVMAYLQ